MNLEPPKSKCPNPYCGARQADKSCGMHRFPPTCDECKAYDKDIVGKDIYITADALPLPESWTKTTKIEPKQEHTEYLICVNWWLQNATQEWWRDLARSYPDIPVLDITQEVYDWLTVHTDKKYHRIDLNQTIRQTWCKKRQMNANFRKRRAERIEASVFDSKKVVL